MRVGLFAYQTVHRLGQMDRLLQPRVAGFLGKVFDTEIVVTGIPPTPKEA